LEVSVVPASWPSEPVVEEEVDLEEAYWMELEN